MATLRTLKKLEMAFWTIKRRTAQSCTASWEMWAVTAAASTLLGANRLFNRRSAASSDTDDHRSNGTISPGGSSPQRHSNSLQVSPQLRRGHEPSIPEFSRLKALPTRHHTPLRLMYGRTGHDGPTRRGARNTRTRSSAAQCASVTANGGTACPADGDEIIKVLVCKVASV